MRAQLLGLWSLVVLGTRAAAADTSCVDCEATLVANSDWSNGVLAEGNYYQPTKTGNWLLGRTTTGEGQLELRNDPTDGYYVWNFCPKTHSGYCRVYLAQVITVQAGVTYDFSFEYSVNGVRGSNTLEMSMATYPQRATVFSQYTFTGDTNGWTTFNTNTWTPTESGDLLMTLTWRNDPNDATVKIKSAAMSAVECRNSESTKTCLAEPEPLTTTTTTETTTSAEPEPTVTTSKVLEPDVTTTTGATSTGITSTEVPSTDGPSTTSTSSTASPTKGCGKRRRRKL